MHVRNENSSFPKYMKDMCKLNDTFEIGKKNYCTLSFTGQNGEIVNSIDIVVYDTLGEIAYKEKLADIFTNIKVA